MKSEWQPRQRIRRAGWLSLTTVVALTFLPLRAVHARTEGGPPPEVATIVKTARPALVVLVSTDRRRRWRSFGAGFFISADGLLVTARHVAQSGDNLLAITSDGQRHAVMGFVGEDRDHDVAVLKLDVQDRAHLPLTATLPTSNQWAALVSPTDQWPVQLHSTNAVVPVCSTGRVSSVIDLPGLWTILTTTIPARGGQSGSPLLDAAGEVIGMVPYIGQEQVAGASPATVVRQILTNHGAAAVLPFARRPKKGDANPLVMDADFRAASTAMQQNNWKEVERRMKRVARGFPESPMPLVVLAATCIRRSLWKDAHAHSVKALRLKPDSAFIHLLDGISLSALGRHAESVVALRRSLALDSLGPEYVKDALSLLAKCEAERGHPDRAQEALDDLQRLDADRAAALRDELQRNTALPGTPDAPKRK